MLEQIFKDIFMDTMERLREMTPSDRHDVLLSAYDSRQRESFIQMLNELSECALDLEYYEICATIKKIKDEELSVVD
jgi:hypothetical protein